jgi:hypothetical protein
MLAGKLLDLYPMKSSEMIVSIMLESDDNIN